MLWIKAFHIIFIVTWFAGLFYLPRLFVYHVKTSDDAGKHRFATMERKLFVMMTLGATLTLIFGIAALHLQPGLLMTNWMKIKLLLVVVLMLYHIFCWQIMRAFARNKNQRSEKWYRWFNELPVLILIPIVLLVVLRPF